MAEGWDLSAVVRSCTASAVNNIPNSNDDTNINTNTNTHAAPIRNGKFDDPFDYLAALTNFENEENPFSFPDLVLPPVNGLQELQDSLLPFFPRTSGQANIPGSSISDFGAPSGQNQPPLVQQQLQQQQLYHQQHPPPPPPQPPTSIPFSLPFNNSQQLPQQSQQIQRRQLHQQVSRMPEAGANVFPRASQSSASRSRKKKSNQKRLVMHVAAENLGNDVWAWRKYGQKPIKGSPYPRNYYRCSSSKGCSARKQVERNHADPTMYIVSYTGDHTHPRPTHRNSLAGSTRNKIPTHQKLVIKESEAPSVEKAPCSSPLSGTSLSPTTPLSASMDHEAANESMKAEAGNMDEADMEGHGIESDVAGDGEDDGSEDDENILIPNMTFNEDLIKDLQQLNRAGDGALNVGSSSSNSRHGFGRSPDFGDNFTNWARGNSSAAAGATGGGGR